MKAHELLSDPRRFISGTLEKDGRYDCLGALLKCYPDSEKRAPIAKEVFSLCQSRHGHKRLGRLTYEDALSLLKDCDV
jgi:hypothetical protein